MSRPRAALAAAGRLAVAGSPPPAFRRGLPLAHLRPLFARPLSAAPAASAAAAPADLAAVARLQADLAALATPHSRNNVPDSIRAKVGANLHLRADHPLGQLKAAIQAYFEAGAGLPGHAARFTTYDRLSPVVTLAQNFDDLLIPADHVSRRPTDTYYVDDGRLLRCHMTAHQVDCMRGGNAAWLMVGDVYRRDEVDATHYPVFHQVDGVRVWAPGELPRDVAAGGPAAVTAFVVADLKAALEGLVAHIFGPGTQSRWVEAYFPFTDPSLELEIFWEGQWLEVLGCGAVRAAILANCGRPDSVGWAFGMGLERLAMVMYGIPDIRLFWSSDARFLDQFKGARPGTRFVPYSKYPACYKDVTFWLPPDGYHENDFFALVREVAGDLVERVQLLDAFTHPKTGRTSHCYRILYRHMDRSLTNEEVDRLQEVVRARVTDVLGGTLR
jgi:phenylalanyl-tRNA synthetase alpha chain